MASTPTRRGPPTEDPDEPGARTGQSAGPGGWAALVGGGSPGGRTADDGASSALPSSERVYRGIRQQILNGVLGPGARLVELQLASQFEVSRTPVREALKRLSAEGLVAMDAVRGLVVREVDQSEAEDIYLIREVLDGLAARLASQRATPADRSKLTVLTELMRESARAERWEAVVQMNVAFHEVLYAAAHNEPLSAMGRTLQDAVRRYSAMAFTSPVRLQEVLDEHDQIARALSDGDPDRAESIARDHMVRARENLSALFAEDAAKEA